MPALVVPALAGRLSSGVGREQAQRSSGTAIVVPASAGKPARNLAHALDFYMGEEPLGIDLCAWQRLLTGYALDARYKPWRAT